MASETISEKQRQINTFRDRARSLKRQAHYTLFLITFLLFLGALIFYLASDIAQNDISIGSLSQLDQGIQHEMSAPQTAQFNSAQEQRFGLEILEDKKVKEKLGLPSTSKVQQEANISFLIQTNIIRFGPMLAILVLVLVLVKLYQYHMRLSVFYDAQADAMVLQDIGFSPEEMERYINILSPVSHDLAKSSKAQRQKFMEHAKTAVSTAEPS